MNNDKKAAPAKAMVDATAKYREDEDDLGDFESMCFKKDYENPIPVNNVVGIYKQYCRQQEIEPMKDDTFRRRMGKRPGWKHGKKWYHGSNVNCFIGWREKANWGAVIGDPVAIKTFNADQGAIIDLVQKTPEITTIQMSEALKWPPERLESAMWELMRAGEIVEKQKGKYIRKLPNDKQDITQQTFDDK
jgi:hypothetical protein